MSSFREHEHEHLEGWDRQIRKMNANIEEVFKSKRQPQFPKLVYQDEEEVDLGSYRVRKVVYNDLSFWSLE